MDELFEKFLSNLSSELIKETYDYVKSNDKLLFAKLGVLNFCDAEGFDMTKVLDKIKKADEKKLVSFINPELYNEIESVDDIIKTFEYEMSKMDYFFWTYCYYNGYCVDNVYFENVKNGNFDGVFSVMTRDEKVEVLSPVSQNVKQSMKTIYTNESLMKSWNKLTKKEKESTITAWF